MEAEGGGREGGGASLLPGQNTGQGRRGEEEGGTNGGWNLPSYSHGKHASAPD